jgi:DNA polymerase-3 subunit gamma/tau
VLQRVERLERRLTAAGPATADEPVRKSTPAEQPGAERPRAEPAAARAHAAQPTATVRPESTDRPPVVAQGPTSAKSTPTKTTEPAVAEQPAEQAAASVPPPADAAPPAESAPVSDPGALDASALRRLWPEVLEVVKQSSRRTRALLDNAQITDVAGELVSLAAPGALAKMIGEDSNTSVLRAALTKVVGGEWRIGVDGAAPVSASADASRRGPAGAPASEPDPRDDADYEPEPGADAPSPSDPEAEAMKLLRDQLGARPLDS